MTVSDIQWPAVLEGRFEWVERLDTGRRSTVIHAVERSTDRHVTVEILHQHLVDQEAIRRRLRRELAAVRRLEHPAVIRIYDLIEEDDVVALIKEYVEGPTIRRRVEQQGPMDWEEATPILDSVLGALDEAHQKGIWHRDLNAEHVVIDADNKGRVGGFGIARVDELVALTMHTRVLGALEAMAPERVLGMDYDGRADLYSVGAVAYELLVGHPPVDGSMREAFFHASDSELGPADEIPADLTGDARYFLERSLAGDMGARFATASQMRRALRGAYDEQMWRGWAARNTEYCPDCNSPIIDGISRCIICGHEFRRLVQNPGEGDWMIRIVSPHDAFEPGVWFESNMEPKYLSEEQFGRLMAMLESHEDTEQLADGDWEYRWPPYVLLSDLTRDDARRVLDKLRSRSIPCEMLRELPGTLRNAFSGSGRQNGVTVAIALVLVTGLFTVHVDVPIPDALAVAGFVVFAAALFASQLLLVPIKRRLGSRKDIQRRRGHAFMIPTEKLRGQTRVSNTVVLPERTGTILNSIADNSVRREVYELLVLAVSVARDDAQRAEAVADIVEEILDIAVVVDDLSESVGQNRTVELFQKLQQLEIRLDSLKEANDSDRAHRLHARRRECLDAMEQHDRIVSDMTMLKARLVTARGALLDLRSDIGDETTEVVLDFDGGAQQGLAELQSYLEAGLQLEATVSAS